VYVRFSIVSDFSLAASAILFKRAYVGKPST
jgi:hypothetical protein